MTKPTGRPRGRPKTKEHVTLMARVDIALANQVKRYASLHRQPISVIIRDALTLLMEEYPAGADVSGPRRLAAHELLSDRYESPLDILLSDTDSAELEELLSERDEEVVDTLLSGAQRDAELLSDTKEDMADRMSDRKSDSVAPRMETPARARPQTVSDGKAAQSGGQSISTADVSPLLSDTKAAITDVLQRRRGRQRSPRGQRILALLQDHPEGLSAEELRVYLKAEKRLGDTLQGMKRNGVVKTQGQGKAVRYRLP